MSNHDPENSNDDHSFRIHGVVKVKETENVIPGLIVEAYDKDRLWDDYLRSGTTDSEGLFEIVYDQEDFQHAFFEQKPDLYLHVTTSKGMHIHTTEDAIRYGAGRTEEFNIDIPQDNIPQEYLSVAVAPIVGSITVSPQLAKADDNIEVTVSGESGGHVRFSIGNVFGATDVPMTEDPDKPGRYSGHYIVSDWR